MPRLYRKADDCDGLWLEFYYPPGMDLAVVCGPRGWKWRIEDVPAEVKVVDAHGHTVREAPVVAKPAPEPPPEPAKGKDK